jgi:hypothetical protein
MKLNTDSDAMLRVANKVALDYSKDEHIIGVLVRYPMPDDPDFPQTCDVELALVTRHGVDPWRHGYGLARRSVDDVFLDICALDVQLFQSEVTNPTLWLQSLGDPRAYEVLYDFDSGRLTELFSSFKNSYLTGASNRLPIWLKEAKQHLFVAMDTTLGRVPRFSEAAFSLAYLTSALLDLSGRTFAGTFLKLPPKLSLVSVELAEEFTEYFPGQEKDPFETAQQLSMIAQELALIYPKSTTLSPMERGVMEYNLNPTEVEYRTFVIREIAEKDKITALWYVRAWAGYLLFCYADVMSRRVQRYEPPAEADAIYVNICGNPDAASVELFIGWVDQIFESTSSINPETHSLE